MTFDELQKTWQSQKTGLGLMVDSNLLLKEVQRNKKYIEYAIFWRDFREVGAAVIMFFVFLYFGFKLITLPCAWSIFLMAPLTLWIGVFLVADRIIQKKRRPKLSDSLVDCIGSSLAQINHQIWLLKNVFWWYLLPPTVGIAIVAAQMTWMFRKQAVFVIGACIYAILVILLFWGVYHLNQRAVRKELLPRRQELEELLSSLKNVGR